jgi:hypothetical protein
MDDKPPWPRAWAKIHVTPVRTASIAAIAPNRAGPVASARGASIRIERGEAARRPGAQARTRASVYYVSHQQAGRVGGAAWCACQRAERQPQSQGMKPSGARRHNLATYPLLGRASYQQNLCKTLCKIMLSRLKSLAMLAVIADCTRNDHSTNSSKYFAYSRSYDFSFRS